MNRYSWGECSIDEKDLVQPYFHNPTMGLAFTGKHTGKFFEFPGFTPLLYFCRLAANTLATSAFFFSPPPFCSAFDVTEVQLLLQINVLLHFLFLFKNIILLYCLYIGLNL